MSCMRVLLAIIFPPLAVDPHLLRMGARSDCRTCNP